ncbi:DNA topoisomerase IV [Flavobacterium sp. N1718]|nr:DNA topoisomerase IV [Flavobacterium sp. N1718]
MTTFLSCLPQPETDCKAYHTGRFRFELDVDGVKKSTVLDRTENFQYETFEGKTDTASVRWVNDCEFILQEQQPKSVLPKRPIRMKILTTSKNSYTFEYGIVGEKDTRIGTAYRIP